MNHDAVTYQESTPWPAWAVAILTASFVGTALLVARDALVSSSATGAAGAWAGVALLLLGPAALWLVLGRLDVRVTRTALRLAFGDLPLIRKEVPFSDIVALEPVRYSPLAEFGGWGIRFGFGGKRAWTIRGNRAVRLTLRGGRRLYVGSRDPERLVEEIRRAGGGRWNTEGGRS
jgi:hypothetical protein